MNAPFETPVFHLYAVCASLVVVLLFALAFYTAAFRGKVKTFVNPEDKALDKEGVISDMEHSAVQRAKRAHLNLLESAVPFFVVGLLYAATNPSLGVAQALFGTFVAARVLHAIFYLLAKQPFRTLSFVVGSGVVLAMTEEVLRAAL